MVSCLALKTVISYAYISLRFFIDYFCLYFAYKNCFEKLITYWCNSYMLFVLKLLLLLKLSIKIINRNKNIIVECKRIFFFFQKMKIFN